MQGTAYYLLSDFKTAKNVLDMVPEEPLGVGRGRMAVTEHHKLEMMTLELWLTSMMQRKKGAAWTDSYMLITHGLPEYIKIGLCAERPAHLKLKDLQALIEFCGPKGNRAKTSKHFGLDEDDVVLDIIQSQIMEVRKQSIPMLAIRACNIGNSPAYLQAIAELLNIKSVSAPLFRDFFGFDTNAILAPSPQKWNEVVAIAKKMGLAPPIGTAPNRLLMALEQIAHSAQNIHTVAESPKSVPEFYNQFFYFNNVPAQWGEAMGVCIHGIFDNKKFYFPKQPEYERLFRVIDNPKYVLMPPPALELPTFVPPEPDPNSREYKRMIRRMQRAAFINRMLHRS